METQKKQKRIQHVLRLQPLSSRTCWQELQPRPALLTSTTATSKAATSKAPYRGYMSATFLAAASRRRQDAASQAGPGPSLPAGFLPLPVVDGATLTYERFLREYALPRQPCLITNLGPSWRAREWSAEYLLAHEGVDQTHRVHMADGPPQEAKERQRCIRATASRLLAAGTQPPLRV